MFWNIYIFISSLKLWEPTIIKDIIWTKKNRLWKRAHILTITCKYTIYYDGIFVKLWMKEDPFSPIRGNCDSLHTRHSSTNRSSKHPSFCLYGFTNFDSYKVVLISVLSFMTSNIYKKSLKIPKGQSESLYRRTDNTMAKRKSTKGQTTIYKTYTTVS
jgi:hypothetical protein